MRLEVRRVCDVIDHAVRMRGLRWRAVAELLPGRTESGCRNR